MGSDLERLFASPHDTFMQVMKIIDEGGLGIALIVNEPKHLLGVITDGDIRRALLKGTDAKDTIEKTFVTDPVVLSEDMSGDDTAVLQLLQSESFKRKGARLIPILDSQGQPTRLVNAEELGYRSGTARLLRHTSVRKHTGRVLVIGGAGYIGSVLVRHLLKAGYHVKVLDLALYGSHSLDELRDNPAFEFTQGNTCHIDTLLSAIQSADSVVHLAELVGDPLCASNPTLALQTNYLATQTIAQICSHLQVNRFIYTSSCSAYGASADPEMTLDESSELAPVSVYARMKINSERAILGMSNGNFAPCILRLGTVFGVSPRQRFDLVVNTLSAQAFFEGTIQIFGGNQWRPHTHVSDVARAIQTVIESPIDHVAGQVFNIVGENLQIGTLGELVRARLPYTSIIYNNEIADQRNYRVSGDKVRSTLGLCPAVTVAEGINELVSHLETNPGIDYKDRRYRNELFVNRE